MAFEHYDKCSLLLPMDGANNGTVFTDWSLNPKTVTVNGNAKTSVAQSKYYGSSAYFDGTGDYLSIPNNADFAFGTNDFGVGCWVRPESFSVDREILSHRHTTIDTAIFTILRIVSSTGKVRFYHTNTGGLVTDITSVAGLTLNVWSHVEINRISGSVKIYVNGVNNDTITSNLTTSYESPNAPFLIGVGNNTAGNPLLGHLQDLIINNGEGLHSSDFTPPARLIGELSNANALAPVEDEAGTPSERTIIAVPRAYPTRAFGTVSDVNGDFTLRAPATECSVFAIHEGSPIKNDIIQRVIPV